MTYQNLLTERIDKVGLITLNRPEKLNALSYELACELDEELTKIEEDDNVSVVILTGAGPRAFSAGGDIHQMVKSTPEELAARDSQSSHLAPCQFLEAHHRCHQRPRLRRRSAAHLNVGYPHRLRARRVPVPRRKIRPREFHLVVASGRRPA